MKKEPIKIICNKCGNEMPIDKEMSNENWKVYKNECPCGGSGRFDFSKQH